MRRRPPRPPKTPLRRLDRLLEVLGGALRLVYWVLRLIRL